MELKRIILESPLRVKIRTEILYSIAAARADGYRLVLVEHGDKSLDTPRILKGIELALKELRKNGRIEFYATVDEFTSSGAVNNQRVQYILNKFPSLPYEDFSSDAFVVWI